MKVLKITKEVRVDTEEEARLYIDQFKKNSVEGGYVVSAAGYTLKQKKKKGEIVDEGYLVKTVELYESFWDEVTE